MGSFTAQNLTAGGSIIIAGGNVGGTPQIRVPVPGVLAPADYVHRPEVTQPLLRHLLNNCTMAGRVMISAVHGLGGIGKTTIARWLVWRPEIEKRFSDGRIWITLVAYDLSVCIL